MELNINDFRDWLYDRIEDDDGVVVVDAGTFLSPGLDRGAACPVHEYITDAFAIECEVLCQSVNYATSGSVVVSERIPLWVERFIQLLDPWFCDLVSIPDAYDCLAILDEIEVGKRGKQRKS